MKHIKIFENEHLKISNLIESLSEQKNELYFNAKIFLENEINLKHVYQIIDMYYEDDNKDELYIIYLMEYSIDNIFEMDNITITSEELNNFHLYIENPEQYMQSKKYNL